ncbi:hypothetical protein [Mycoplasma todarodis]|uniref:hypothetical protein n=1 Tax=Mycoplasma todarodis TaxID=1937191 RepID=UPI003B332E53
MRVRLSYKDKVIKWPGLNTNVVFLGDEDIDKEIILETLKLGISKIEEFIGLAVNKELKNKELVKKLTQTNLVAFIKATFNRFNNLLAKEIKGVATFKITACGIDAIAMAREIRQIIQDGEYEEGITINKIPANIFIDRALAYIYYGSRIAENKTLSIALKSIVKTVDQRDLEVEIKKGKNHFIISDSKDFAESFINEYINSEYVLIKETTKGIKYTRIVK